MIYHPHGFLPQESSADSHDVVLGTTEYLDIMKSAYWRPLLEVALRTHTFLYVGMSGRDLHLQSLINGLSGGHAMKIERIYYHGVRFAISGSRDKTGVVLEKQRLFTHHIPNHEALAGFLFKICQAARSQRMGN
jgi:hypothetical protein